MSTDASGAAAGTTVGEASPMRLVVTLTLAGLLSGVAIVGVHELTLPMIQANQQQALERAIFEVVPEATQMQPLTMQDDALAPAGGPAIPGEERIYAAYDEEGRFRGYAIPGEGPGFQDTIKLLIGYDPARKMVVGMAVLESKETPGLGDKIFKDPAFAANFEALEVEPGIVLTKKPTGAAGEVDAITGATISSRAVVNIISAACERWRPRLPAPGAEPGLEPPEER